MPKFSYVALDAKGQETRGEMDAGSSNDVIASLRQSGYYPTSVTESGSRSAVKSSGSGVKSSASLSKASGKSAAPAIAKPGAPKSMKGKKVASKPMMIFTRQLATLIDAGLPLLKGLDVLAKQERNKVLQFTLRQLADSVQGGSTFSESLAQHPAIFNKLYVNMVKAGELGGVLEIVLQRLAEFQEKAQKLKNKVQSAMIYPVIVLSIAVLIMVFLLLFIVPKFQAIFKDMLGDKPLPGLTQFVIGVSQSIQSYWWLIAIVITALVFGYKAFAATPKGVIILDQIALKVPLLGDLIRKGAISRFSRTLGTLVSSGVPILQALTITKETAGNHVIADAIGRVHDSVKEGETIATPLDASRVFPPMVISMIDVGEETGQLPDMLLKIADVYDDEVDNAVAGITSMLEPIMIVFLAVVVGTIVIALFLPLITIIQELQGGGN